jgi:hypothetical protein
MSQGEKSRLYKALQGAGVEFTKHYREYKTDELQAKYDELERAGVFVEKPAAPPVDVQPTAGAPVAGDPDAAAFFGFEVPDEPEPTREEAMAAHPTAYEPPPVQAEPSRAEMPGEHLNTHEADEIIRVDDQGRQWIQNEIRKPATPQPRGRRVLTYVNTGTEQQSVTLDDGTVESFEVAGRGTRTAEVKITLPSYQVGIYRDPRFPFKVYTYGGVNGFDLFGVQEFYGGPELVPASIKRMYVSNVLCYDVRTTIQAIEAEARQLALAGRIEL